MLILRPSGPGDPNYPHGFPYQFPDSGEHWDKVDEEVQDGDQTYVSFSTPGIHQHREELYRLPPVTPSGAIEKVMVKAYCQWKGAEGGYGATVMLLIHSHGSSYGSDVWHSGGDGIDVAALRGNNPPDYPGEMMMPSEREGWKLRWGEFPLNPFTKQPWTWEEINGLEIGTNIGVTIDSPASTGCLTQIWAEVHTKSNGVLETLKEILEAVSRNSTAYKTLKGERDDLADKLARAEAEIARLKSLIDTPNVEMVKITALLEQIKVILKGA